MVRVRVCVCCTHGDRLTCTKSAAKETKHNIIKSHVSELALRALRALIRTMVMATMGIVMVNTTATVSALAAMTLLISKAGLCPNSHTRPLTA